MSTLLKETTAAAGQAGDQAGLISREAARVYNSKEPADVQSRKNWEKEAEELRKTTDGRVLTPLQLEAGRTAAGEQLVHAHKHAGMYWLCCVNYSVSNHNVLI